jgi:heterodisulfide reductase subunit C
MKRLCLFCLLVAASFVYGCAAPLVGPAASLLTGGAALVGGQVVKDKSLEAVKEIAHYDYKEIIEFEVPQPQILETVIKTGKEMGYVARKTNPQTVELKWEEEKRGVVGMPTFDFGMPTFIRITAVALELETKKLEVSLSLVGPFGEKAEEEAMRVFGEFKANLFKHLKPAT